MRSQRRRTTIVAACLSIVAGQGTSARPGQGGQVCPRTHSRGSPPCAPPHPCSSCRFGLGVSVCVVAGHPVHFRGSAFWSCGRSPRIPAPHPRAPPHPTALRSPRRFALGGCCSVRRQRPWLRGGHRGSAYGRVERAARVAVQAHRRDDHRRPAARRRRQRVDNLRDHPRVLPPVRQLRHCFGPSLTHFSRRATLHAPCSMLYLVPTRVEC